MHVSNYEAHAYEVIQEHNTLKPLTRELLLDALSPFKTAFDQPLGSCTGKPLHSRNKNYHNLRDQTH